MRLEREQECEGCALEQLITGAGGLALAAVCREPRLDQNADCTVARAELQASAANRLAAMDADKDGRVAGAFAQRVAAAPWLLVAAVLRTACARVVLSRLLDANSLVGHARHVGPGSKCTPDSASEC